MAEQTPEISVVVTDKDEADQATDELAKEARMLDYICARLDECIAYRDGTLEPHLQNLWDIYEADPEFAQKNTPWDNASNLSIALSATYVDQFVAKHVNALRSPVPFLTLSSFHPDNLDAVRALSDYLDWGDKNLWKGQMLCENFERDRCKVGTGVGYIGFTDVPYITRRTITEPPQEVGRLKQPSPRWIPREDFCITPGYIDLDVAPLVGHRSWVALDQLKRLAKDQQITVDFDKLTPSHKTTIYASDQDDVRLADEVAPYEIFHVSFRYDLDEDDYPEDYDAIIHYDSKQLLHYYPCRYAGGRRPYFSAPYVRQEGEFDGKGICEQIEHYQAEVSTIHNQRRDNANLANNIMLKGRPSQYYNEKTRWYPGKMWLINDINDLEVMQFPTNYMSTVTDEQITIGLAERRIGTSDAALGRESTLTNRAAATTTLSLMEQGAQRDDLSVTLARDAFLRYGQFLLESLQIYGLPDAGSATAPEAVLGPERGALVRGLIETTDNILGLVGVNIEVSTKAVNKEMKRQAQTQLYGMIIQNAAEISKMLGVIFNPQTPPPVKDFFMASVKAAEMLLKQIMEDAGNYNMNDLFTSMALDQVGAQMGNGNMPGGPDGGIGAMAAPAGANGAAVPNGAGPPGGVPSGGSY
jgi:hypothetical protein